MDLTKIDNIEIEDINWNDAPEFCDAFIASADYNGKAMTEKQLDEINDNTDFVHDAVNKFIY
jgi:DNA-binding ferritin-like protein (Dps family)